jgi:hypothetical protein
MTPEKADKRDIFQGLKSWFETHLQAGNRVITCLSVDTNRELVYHMDVLWASCHCRDRVQS